MMRGSKSSAINRLSAARFFLFGSRDIWFVVALPVFLADELGWSERSVGGFLAVWVIGYGIVQSFAPRFLARGGREVDEVRAAQQWARHRQFAGFAKDRRTERVVGRAAHQQRR